MRKKDWITMEKILGYANSSIEFCKEISTLEEFDEDLKTSSACAFALIQIGELCACGLTDDFKTQITTIPWPQIKGIRNRIVHGYESIDTSTIWDTVCNDMPALAAEITAILQEHSEEKEQAEKDIK